MLMSQAVGISPLLAGRARLKRVGPREYRERFVVWGMMECGRLFPPNRVCEEKEEVAGRPGRPLILF